MYLPAPVFSPRTIIIDCGARHTALAVFTRRSGRLALGPWALVDLTGASLEAGQWLERTIAAMRGLRRGLPSGGPAVLVLPAHLTLTKLIKVPRIDSARRAGIVQFEAAQYIPTALTEVVWDSVATGRGAQEDEILIAAAKLDLVEPLCLAAEEAGFMPRLVLPAALAAVAGFRLGLDQPLATRLVLHLGARAATLFLIRSDCFWLRPVPLNSSWFEGPSVDESAFERFESEMKRALALLQTDSGGELPASVQLAGTAQAMPGLNTRLATRLGLAVERWEVSDAFAPAAAPAAPTRAAGALTELAGAAATQLFPHATILNLLPAPRRRRDEFHRRLPALVTAGLLAVAAPMPPWLYYHGIAAAARARSAAIERMLEPLRAGSVRQHRQLLVLDRFKREVAALEAISARRNRWLALLADLQVRLLRVDDVWLERLHVIPGEPGGPLQLSVSGCLLDRANPVARVSEENVTRVKDLFADIADSPFVATIEGERFDNTRPGLLRFDFIMRTDPRFPL